MSHISYEHGGVEAKYSDLDIDDVVIELDDASYAKAEYVLYNATRQTLHAVMHEGAFLIGRVPDECSVKLSNNGNIILSARHYSGAMLRMDARVVFVN